MGIICEKDHPYVFISYSHTDHEKVSEALGVLHEAYGLNLWFDEMMSSGCWQNQIFAAMDDTLCKAVVLFASKSALTSKTVLDELKNAAFIKKPVVVINFENQDFRKQFFEISSELNRRDHDKVVIAREIVENYLRPEVRYLQFGDYQGICNVLRDAAPQVFRDVQE